MATSTYICQKVQQALKAYLDAQTWTTTFNVYKGVEAPAVDWDDEGKLKPDRAYPCVVCLCQDAKQDPPFANNWIAEVAVNVYNNADDTTEDQHHAMMQEIMDKVYTTTIAADLSAALADFTAFMLIPDRQSWDVEDRSWRGSFTFQLHCCGSDVS